MIKLWVGKCPTDCFCIEDRDISDCAKNYDGTATPGVFLTDAEYEAMKNCENCKHTYELCEESNCPNKEKWKPKEGRKA